MNTITHSPQQLKLNGLNRYWLLGLALLHLSVPAYAAEVLLQNPVRSGTQPPAPNVIVSVDNSGSMGDTGIQALKDGLLATFSSSNVADGRIRLAWQSMWNECRGFPGSSYPADISSTAFSCGTGKTNYNRMGSLEGTHRSDFIAWVNNLSKKYGTPSHLMMRWAGEYLKQTGDENPWAKVPGSTLTADKEVLSCRKSFHIFMTDGAWNRNDNNATRTIGFDGDNISVGNADGVSRTLPDGITYNPQPPYTDSWGAANKAYTNCASYENPYTFGTASGGSCTKLPSTLSDLAFHYWATDLQPGADNKVNQYMPVLTNEVFGTKTYTPYWNPKNDPATWQHMNTFTIGYNAAANWIGNPVWNATGGTYAGTGYADLMKGTVSWPDPIKAPDGNARQMELWHMALNSRSQFFPAATATDLKDAFQKILATILVQSDSVTTGVAISSNFLNTTNYTNALAFDSGYDPNTWTGSIAAYSFASLGSDNSAPVLNTTPVWRAEDKLADQDWNTGRQILTVNSGDRTKAVPFRWNTTSLSTTQQALLNGSDAKGSDRIDFLRGKTSISGFRVRGKLTSNTSKYNVLGDIADSLPWVLTKPNSGFLSSTYSTYINDNANRTPLIIAGANDGMLHAFQADAGQTSSGKEIFAYVPLGVFPILNNLTSTTYNHQFYVDASPFVGDVDVSGTDAGTWKTYLFATLGAGGKGYFILDLTVPSAYKNNDSVNYFTEARVSASTTPLVVMDRTFDGSSFTGDADVGNILQQPTINATNNGAAQIVQMGNKRWAVIFGNGVNSTNGNAVLLVQYLDGAKELLKIQTGTKGQTNNGLFAPTPMDVDGDGKVDIIYAGDLKGNMWRFDVGNCTPTLCAISAPSEPLFTASSSQAITTAPNVQLYRGPLKTNPQKVNVTSGRTSYVSRYMITFGTGRLLTNTDMNNKTSKDAIYSILDTGIAANLTDLVKHEIGLTTTITGLEVRTLKKTKVINTAGDKDYPSVDLSTQRGWYLELPKGGERVVDRMLKLDGDYVAISSTLPTVGEACSQSGNVEYVYTTIMNIYNGTPYKLGSVPIFDTNQNNIVQATKDETTTDKGRLENTSNTNTAGKAVVEGIITAQVDYRSSALVDVSSNARILLKKGRTKEDGLGPDAIRVKRGQTYTRIGWRELQ